MDTLLPLLESILMREEVIAAAALFLAGLIGRARLERIPFIGVVVSIIARTIDAVGQNLEASRASAAARSDVAQADKIDAAASVARVLVEGQEQLKTSGKTDGATAAVEVTRALSTEFALSNDVARMLTERAVRELHLP